MNVLTDVAAECERQDVKWGVQDHPDGTGVGVEVVPLWYSEDLEEWAKNRTEVMAQFSQLTWRDILMEEVAEAFKESDIDKLQAELVQVSAVAAQWAAAIDRRRDEPPC